MRQTRRLVCTMVAYLLFAPVCRADADPSFQVLNPKVHQGDLVVVKLGQYYVDKNVGLYAFDKVYASDKNGLVFVGVDFDQVKSGSYMVYLVDLNTEQRIDWNSEEIEVVAGSFPVTYYKSFSGGPSKKRIKEEVVISSVFVTNEKSYMSGKFYEPLQKIEISGDYFGTHRVYREGVVHLHRGVDLRAKPGTSVFAMNSGRVVLASKFSLEGNLVVIDHGLGVFSIYMHLSQFKVKKGQMVNPRQVIALSGATGRGSGPHLHLAMKVNGASIDPLRFIDTINAVLIR